LNGNSGSTGDIGRGDQKKAWQQACLVEHEIENSIYRRGGMIDE
jgi:hypothetical protein